MSNKEHERNERFKYIVLPKRAITKAMKSKKIRNTNKYSDEILKLAHKHSSHNKEEILESGLYCCFSCLKTFKPQEIFNWCDEQNSGYATAMCPFCYVDSVIGSKSGYPVDDPVFPEEMHGRKTKGRFSV